ncbi:MAG TPA: hypothetical protein VGO92_15235 [Acidimicrobiales bacterium]|jgi:hypothetical protein|nr:hypothetical protein [Acidimicrobiales bacterium]
MATPGPAAPAVSAGPDARGARSDDWAAQAADTIDRVITGIGDKTARPLTAIAGAIVFGLVLAAVGFALLVLLAVASVRALNVYLPIEPYSRAVWVSDAIVGGIFTLIGLFVWRKRRPKRT